MDIIIEEDYDRKDNIEMKDIRVIDEADNYDDDGWDYEEKIGILESDNDNNIKHNLPMIINNQEENIKINE